MKSYKQFLMDQPSEKEVKISGDYENDRHNDSDSNVPCCVLDDIKQIITKAKNLFGCDFEEGSKSIVITLKDAANGENRGNTIASVIISARPDEDSECYGVGIRDLGSFRDSKYASLSSVDEWKDLADNNKAAWSEIEHYKKVKGESSYRDGMEFDVISAISGYLNTGNNVPPIPEHEFHNIKDYILKATNDASKGVYAVILTPEELRKFANILVSFATNGKINHGFLNLMRVLDPSFKPNGIILPHEAVRIATGKPAELTQLPEV